MKMEEIEQVIEAVDFPGYTFGVYHDGYRVELFATFDEACSVTGRVEMQKTREWGFDMREATPSSVVATAFKCVIASMEHETRERFTYRGRPIFHPHQNVDALLAICEQRET